MGSLGASTQLTPSQQQRYARKQQRIREAWFKRPPGWSKYAGVPRRVCIVQDAHSAYQEDLYAWMENLPAAFRTSAGYKVVKFGYRQAHHAIGHSVSAIIRARNSLLAKDDIEIFEVEHRKTGGRRIRGEGNNKPTYYVVLPYTVALAKRRSDPKIGKCKRGYVYCIGRGKRLLTPQEIDLWRLNDDYPVRAQFASVPRGAEAIIAEWQREHPEEVTKPEAAGDQQPSLFAEPPPPPPLQATIPKLGKGSPPIPPESVWAFNRVCKARAGYDFVWKFISEMRRAAEKLGFVLPDAVLGELMESRYSILARKQQRPNAFSYFYTVRELVNPTELAERNCPPAGKVEEWEAGQRAKAEAQQAQQAAEAARAQAEQEALDRALNDPAEWRRRAAEQDQRALELRQKRKTCPPEQDEQLGRELHIAETSAAKYRAEAEKLER